MARKGTAGTIQGWWFNLWPYSVCLFYTLGSLSNDDGDGNENGKKATGLDKQNKNFARASRFFVHFLAVVARLQRESA